MKKLSILLVLTFLISFTIIVSSACGGFFCTNVPIDQSAERIIFTVNGDGTITAIVGINYTGNAEDFSWVVPVPSPPDLDVAETDSLDTLQSNTQVRVNLPERLCRDLFFYGSFGGGGGGLLAETGNVGPYDFAILGSQDSAEMISWLRENGYRVTEEMEPLIDLYVDEGMYFLAMKLSQESEVGDIQPIVMTYEAENPTIPIRLTAVAAIDDMPILVWIFADSYYEPMNYANPPIDLSNARGVNSVDLIGKNLGLFFGSGGTANRVYTDFQNEVQEEHDGLAFITEYAQPTSRLSTSDDPLLNALSSQFSHLTRLRAQMSPDQMTLDPIFVPTADDIEQDTVIEMTDFVDPLHFWGCATDKGVDLEAVDATFTTHTRIEDWLLDVVHPEDWILSEISFNSSPHTPYPEGMFILSPETVTQETINAYFAGEETPPMMVIVEEYWIGWEVEFGIRTMLGLHPRDGTDDFVDELSVINDYIPPVERRYTPFSEAEFGRTVALSVLTTQADWEANQAMYELMLDYGTSYQYYLSPDHRNTLFVNKVGIIPFPDGWQYEYIDNQVYITPDGLGEDSEVQFHSRLLQQDNIIYEWQFWAETYQTPGDVIDTRLQQSEDNPDLIYEVTPFGPDENGQMGYFKLTRSGYLLKVSSPEAQWTDLEPIMLPMLTTPLPFRGSYFDAYFNPNSQN